MGMGMDEHGEEEDSISPNSFPRKVQGQGQRWGWDGIGIGPIGVCSAYAVCFINVCFSV
jgi:hypothetical protein